MPRNHGATLWAVLLTSSLLLFSAACKVAPPGKVETSVMTSLKRRVTVRGKDDRSPFSATEQDVVRGKKAFGSYCTSCHGLDGQNTGVPFADRMSPPVASLASASVQNYTDGQLHWVIQNGISPSGMPASKDLLSDEEIWEIVAYIRHLPPKGSLGAPPFYSGQ